MDEKNDANGMGDPHGRMARLACSWCGTKDKTVVTSGVGTFCAACRREDHPARLTEKQLRDLQSEAEAAERVRFRPQQFAGSF